MSEKRRTFHVPVPGAVGYTHQVILRNTAPRVWRTSDGAMFMHLGHAQLGEKGRRYRVEKWSAPHTERTFTSLQSALNAWVRATMSPAVEEQRTAHAEKKSPKQLDAEIAAVTERPVTTAKLRAAMKAIDPSARVAPRGEGAWTVRTDFEPSKQLRQAIAALGLAAMGLDVEGSRWDWTHVLTVQEPS